MNREKFLQECPNASYYLEEDAASIAKYLDEQGWKEKTKYLPRRQSRRGQYELYSSCSNK